MAQIDLHGRFWRTFRQNVAQKLCNMNPRKINFLLQNVALTPFFREMWPKIFVHVPSEKKNRQHVAQIDLHGPF